MMFSDWIVNYLIICIWIQYFTDFYSEGNTCLPDSFMIMWYDGRWNLISDQLLELNRSRDWCETVTQQQCLFSILILKHVDVYILSSDHNAETLNRKVFPFFQFQTNEIVWIVCKWYTLLCTVSNLYEQHNMMGNFYCRSVIMNFNTLIFIFK